MGDSNYRTQKSIDREAQTHLETSTVQNQRQVANWLLSGSETVKQFCARVNLSLSPRDVEAEL